MCLPTVVGSYVVLISQRNTVYTFTLKTLYYFNYKIISYYLVYKI